jgi:hypothetical protein
VRQRRLKERLAGAAKWEEFNGTSELWLTLDGHGAVDDNVIEHPSGAYRAMSIRPFDASTAKWAILVARRTLSRAHRPTGVWRFQRRRWRV